MLLAPGRYCRRRRQVWTDGIDPPVMANLRGRLGNGGSTSGKHTIPLRPPGYVQVTFALITIAPFAVIVFNSSVRH